MLTPPAIYDRIGSSYGHSRRPDPRLAQLINRHLLSATSVVNVGAGMGSYEPTDCPVVAVDPSMVMLAQRPAATPPAVRACAERLPFGDNSFDAAMAVLTVHHWSGQTEGLRELSRVARQTVVVVTWDPASAGFWLTQDYFPQFIEADRQRMPPVSALQQFLEDSQVIPVPIPSDCTDGFLGAYWRRPEAYLDASVRRGMSSFARCQDLSPLQRLEAHLRTGEWRRRYANLLDRDELDIGYRLIVGRPAGPFGFE